MLDAFLRLLVNTLAAAGFTTVAIVIERQFQLVRRAAGDPLLQGLLAVAICLLLVLFAQVRWLLQRWLTRAVFRRPDLDGTVQGIQKLGALAPEEATFVQQAAELAREYTSAEAVLVRDSGTPEGVLARPTALPDRRDPGASLEAPWAEVIVPLRFSRGDHMEILLGRRRGGRRYLSEELEGLDRLAAAIVEQVERLRNSEMQRLVSQAELRALQAQINPHFLFNSLNTLYGTIPRGAAEARRTVVNLADIFRYFLQSEKVFLPLSEELRIVEAYLEIESLRLGKRLRKEICVDPAALPVPIPMLSLQPLVENAVKHGIAASPDPGCVSVRAEMTEGGLRIRVGDSGSGRANNPQAKTGSGLGLENVRRRLKLCYGPQCDLAVSFSPTGSSVEFVIPAAVSELVRS
jgi:two-component system LytT family sensor kinase